MNDSDISLPVCYIGTFEVAFDLAANLNVPLNVSVMYIFKNPVFMRAEIFDRSEVTFLIEVLLIHNPVRRNSSKASVCIERSGLNMFSIKSCRNDFAMLSSFRKSAFSIFFFMNEE